jgi:hypothetical protein
MEPVGPPWNTPGGLARLQAVRSVKHRIFERDNCHSGKEWCQAAGQPRATITQHNRCKIAATLIEGF